MQAQRVYVELGVALETPFGDKRDGSESHLEGQVTFKTVPFVTSDTELYVALPHIMREETGVDEEDMQWVVRESMDAGYRGVLARNLEQVGYLIQNEYQGEIVTDASLYVWNNDSVSFLKDVCGDSLTGVTLPYELSYQELQEIKADVPRTMVVYGRIPMMVSANCVRKTTSACFRNADPSGTTTDPVKEYRTATDLPADVHSDNNRFKLHEQHTVTITDRMQHDFPVMLNCRYCYNVILNTVPLSLHKQMPLMARDSMAEVFRVDLTTESTEESEAVLTYWKRLIKKALFDKAKAKVQTPPYEDYTTGNYRRSAE